MVDKRRFLGMCVGMPRTVRRLPEGIVFYLRNCGNSRDRIFDDYAIQEKGINPHNAWDDAGTWSESDGRHQWDCHDCSNRHLELFDTETKGTLSLTEIVLPICSNRLNLGFGFRLILSGMMSGMSRSEGARNGIKARLLKQGIMLELLTGRS